MKVLLIWEMFPETTQLFLLDGECAALALAAHGGFVNSPEDDLSDAVNALSVALAGVAPLDVTDPVDIGEPARVVLAGFIM